MRRFAKIAIALAVLVAIVTIGTPRFLSSDLVKQKVADQLSALTGRTVSLNGSSSVSLSPYLGVAYDNVTFGPDIAGGDDASPNFISMDKMRARLGKISALWGDAKLTEVTLVRPRINLRIDENGEPNWLVKSGPLAQRLSLEPGEAPSALSLGTIVIEDGIVDIADARSGTTTSVTGLNGEISWADIDASGSAQLTAVWRGEVVKLDAQAQSPFELMRGGKSDLTASLTAKPLTATFKGSVDTQQKTTANGQFNSTSPSLRRLSEWLGRSLPAFESVGSTSLSGQVVATPGNMEFSEARVKLDEHSGTGRLQIAVDENEALSVNGTLAFETLRLPSLLDLATATSQSQTDGTKNDSVLDFSFLSGLTLDLRLSAELVVSEPFQLSNLAASAIVREGNAIFDIGQANGLDGTLSGSIALRSNEDRPSVATDLVLTDIDLEEFSSLYGTSIFSLSGRGNAEFKLKTTGFHPKQELLHLNGEGEVTSANGTLHGIDLAKIVDFEDKKEDASSDFSGTTDYQKLRIGVFISNGIAFMRNSQLEGDNLVARLSGRSDLARRSLALRGQIRRAEEENPATTVPFLIGGVASAPLFVPLSGLGPKKGTSEPAEDEVPSQ